MYVRLAFAVAAYLESEILIVDEVLAVGDTEFQKKCLSKMRDVSINGRTVLFVSHNLTSINALCTKGILLEKGKVVFNDTIKKTTGVYNNVDVNLQTEVILRNLYRPFIFESLIFDRIVFDMIPINFGEPIGFALFLKNNSDISTYDELDFGIAINDQDGNCIIHCSNRFLNKKLSFHSEKQAFYFKINNNLKPGIYNLEIFLRVRETIQDWIKEEIYIEVANGNPYNYIDSSNIQGVTFPYFDIIEINDH